ncbi:MAG: NBR1-Ig-like domain-containing protein [Chloroflexota bacterium]
MKTRFQPRFLAVLGLLLVALPFSTTQIERISGLTAQQCTTCVNWDTSGNCLETKTFTDPTNNHYPCGQCTWWASYSRPDIPDSWVPGDNPAYKWYEYAKNNVDFEVSDNPEPGAIAVWEPYAMKGMGSEGHVAYVTWVNFDGSFYVTEMNYDFKGSLHSFKYSNSSKVHFILAGVTLFSDKNFGGDWIRFRAASPDLYSWGSQVSSVYIPSGWDVLFFKNNNYASSSYRHRWGGTDYDALESSFWDLSIDFYSDGSNMNDSMGSITLSNVACLLDPSQSFVQDQFTKLIQGEPICSAPTPPPPPSPEPPPSTTDSATFISHVTLPDGWVVSPGQSLTKTWRVKNTGTSTWGSGYQLAFTGGEQMGAPSAVNVPATAPGQEADISVNITAPFGGGSHQGNWRLRNPQGTYFGDELWVKITVDAPNPGSGQITMFDVSPASPSSASTVHVVGRIKPSPDFRSMRFVLGNEVQEMTNFKQVGDQYEISTDWNTGSLARGNYAIVFEVAKTGDPSWVNAERQVKTYTLVGTPVTNNLPPDRPVLKSPYDWYLKDSAGASASVELCTYPSSDPDGNPVKYWFEVKDQGGGVYASSGWSSNACWTHTYAPNTYSWRVKAGDGSAESDWSSETWHFSVAGGGVYIGNHAIFDVNTDNTHMCVFVTYDGIRAPDVRAWINEAPDGSENGEWRLLDHYGPNTTPDCTQPNYHGFWIRSTRYETGNHAIRITAVKPDSGNSATKKTNYNIAYIRPPAPDLIAPSTNTNNGTWWNARKIHFEWSQALRTSNYTLRVSTSSNPWDDPSPLLNQVLGSEVTSYDYTLSQDYAQLYWSVKASNSAGSADSGSDIWFGIDLVKPSCQVQPLPSTTYESVFQVNWSGSDNMAGVGSFNVQYQDSERGAWDDWLTGIPSTKAYELFTGQPGHTYSFRCLATDNANNPGSYPSTADTQTLVDPTSRPPTAWWDAAYSGKRNLTILNNMPGVTLPVGYPVHLHFDSGTTPTAAELFNASQSTPKCNDLRVVYNDAVELDRLVDHCDSSAIDLWFRTQVSVSGGASNSTAHQLYYGNASASSPPTNRSHIFYPSIDSNHRRVFDMREGTGLTLYDATGNGNATMSGELSWTSSGKFGPAVLIPGDQTPEPRPAIYAGYGPQPDCNFTAELWLKRLSGHNYGGQLMQQEIGGPNPWRWAFMVDGDKLKLSVEGTADHVWSNAGLGPSTYFDSYHHIAVTHSCSGEVRFYIDGVLDSVRTMSNGNVNPASAPLRIGNNAYNSQRLAGYVFGAALSNVVRTDFTYGQFGSITSEPSVATGLPVDPPNSGFADLAILELSAFPNPTGGILVQAVVENQGNLDTLNGFFTDLYVDHIPTGSGDYTGSLRFWVNDPIAASATVTLTTVITNLPSQSSAYIQSSSLINETVGTLYAQADSAGAIGEPNETDNIYSSGIDVCLATTDAYESDDTAGTASIISLGQTQTHNFDRPGDYDWRKFSAQASRVYELRTYSLDINSDTYLYLYDTDHTTLLASNDDYGGSLASQIEWTAPADGIYYVLVQHWNPNVGGCGTKYDLTLSYALSNKLYLPLIQK